MSSKHGAASADSGKLKSGALNTPELVFMVMAAAAPMGIVVALMPMAFAFGNGPGVPGVYAGAVVAMLLFAVGYVQIIPYVRNAGAFYAYISASFGRTIGLSAAYVASVSYFSLSCSTIGALAYFASLLCTRATGVHTSWILWAAISVALIAYLAYRQLTLTAKVLSIVLILEIALLVALDVAIVTARGITTSNLHSFAPSAVFASGFGIAGIYAFNSLIGVEGTAIYQEEVNDRKRTIPMATYLAIIMTGAFYIGTGWCLVIGTGADSVSTVARSDPGHFVLAQMSRYLGEWAADGLSLLVVSSAFAASLALFNNSARYLYALARDGVLPRQLAKTHARHHSPHVASGFLALLLAVVFSVAFAAHLDPLINITTALVGLGSVGLMALLATTALGIPVFFARRGTWSVQCTIAPAAAGIITATATYLAVYNYAEITGVSSAFINNLPLGLLLITACGVVQARWLLKHRPQTYQCIGSNRID